MLDVNGEINFKWYNLMTSVTESYGYIPGVKLHTFVVLWDMGLVGNSFVAILAINAQLIIVDSNARGTVVRSMYGPKFHNYNILSTFSPFPSNVEMFH